MTDLKPCPACAICGGTGICYPGDVPCPVCRVELTPGLQAAIAKGLVVAFKAQEAADTLADALRFAVRCMDAWRGEVADDHGFGEIAINVAHSALEAYAEARRGAQRGEVQP